jgi:hypothetical protein
MRKEKNMMIDTPPWYGSRTSVTFSDALAAARRRHFTAVISRELGNDAKKPKSEDTPYHSNRTSKKGKTIDFTLAVHMNE